MFQLTSLPQEEVLRYLGYRGSKIPPALEDTIGRCMEETCRLASPAYLYRHFSIAREEDGIRLVGTPYSLKGQDIRSHLAGCEEIYLLCVENRNIAAFLKAALNFKTAGSGNIFQINASETSCQKTYGTDNFIHVLRTDAEGDGIHTAESFEKGAFSLHNGHARFWTNIPKP